MAFNALRTVKVPPNSASLEEARSRVFEFFRSACRAIPAIMDMYNLQDVVAPSSLRSSIASQIRKNSQVTNPKVRVVHASIATYGSPGFVLLEAASLETGGRFAYNRPSETPQCGSLVHSAVQQVIDMLLFKGMEELGNIVEHAKQRHHIIGQYVVGEGGLTQDLGGKDKDASNFLKNFYKSNYF